MIELLKKHKYKIIAAVCALAVLTGAFLAGGSLGDNAPDAVKSSTSDVAVSAENTTVSQSTNESTAPTASPTKATEKSKSEQSTTVPTSTSQTKSEQSAVSNQTSKSSSSSSSTSSKTSSKNSQSSTNTKQDKYKTDPVPIVDNTLKCTFSISCATVLDNMDILDKSKKEIIPDDGWILKPVTVTFNEGESVFDVLKQVCMDNKIQLEFSFTPIYNSAYIEGINNLYEFDCGSISGWTYKVNDWFPNYGCSRYEVKNGDVIELHFTCNNGADVGKNYAVGE